MKEQIKTIGFCIGICGGAFFGVGAAIGAAGDELNHEGTSVESVEKEIQGYKDKLQLFEEYDDTLVRYGNACLAVMTNYEPGGALSSVTQDTAVDDLLANPDLPCGDDATEVRIAVQDILTVKTTLDDLYNEDINEKYKKIASINEANRKDDEYRAWLSVGLFASLLGGAVGMIAGLSVCEETKEAEKRKV